MRGSQCAQQLRSCANRRLTRSTRSGVVVMRKPDAEGSAKTKNPKTTFREGKNLVLTAPDSPHRRIGNRARDSTSESHGIRHLIGPGSRRGSDTGCTTGIGPPGLVNHKHIESALRGRQRQESLSH
jgi:hypothetical protein